jgi:hypothetical protein
MTTLSITRALVELKTLDSRITKAITSSTFILCKTKNRNYQVLEDEFKKNTLGEFQSINDLVLRRAQIKNAIVKSNAKTEVEVAGLKMTVSEAIEYKQVIRYKQELLEILKKQRQMVTIDSEAHRQKVQSKIDENIKIICGKDTKADVQTIQSVTDGIMKGDPVEVYDPLNLDKVIKELEVSVDEYSANVDYVLSESNALTTITV